MKIAILLLGLTGLGGGVALFGLPPKSPPQTPPQTPAKTATPSAATPGAGAPSVANPAPPPSAPAAPQTAALPPLAAPAAPTISPPAFDVVRVEPTGDSVVAGKGEPGAEISLMLNGAVFATAKADAAGHFALVPPVMKPGSYELTLVMKMPGRDAVTSTQTIVVDVPATPNGDVIVALVEPGKPTALLAKPASVAGAPASASPQANAAASAPAAPASGPRGKVTLTTVEADENGGFFASGVAAPGASVRLYLNDSFLATAMASPQGAWSFTIGKGLSPGPYRVRVDDVEASGGRVLSRAEVSFDYRPKLAASGAASQAQVAAAGSKAAGSNTSGSNTSGGNTPANASGQAPASSDVVVAEIRSTQVTRGDSLWRISKRIYGKGLRFTVIYEANQKQIQDPDRIYPGQVFVLPNSKT